MRIPYRPRCGRWLRRHSISAFNVTPQELAQMHPLVRAAIAAAARDERPARALSALVNAIRPLIKLEQDLAAARTPYDLDGQVVNPPEHDPR